MADDLIADLVAFLEDLHDIAALLPFGGRDLLHAEGVMTMTSITGSSDKVKNPYDRRVAYLRELVAEPDIIETDYPSEFIGLPWSRDAIHALQEAAMRSHRTNLK